MNCSVDELSVDYDEKTDQYFDKWWIRHPLINIELRHQWRLIKTHRGSIDPWEKQLFTVEYVNQLFSCVLMSKIFSIKEML